MSIVFFLTWLGGWAVIAAVVLLGISHLGRSVRCVLWSDLMETISDAIDASRWLTGRLCRAHQWAWKKSTAANLADINARTSRRTS
jgi:hypothetical protein